jgi:hypothetical protein
MQSILRFEFLHAWRGDEPPIIISPHQFVLSFEGSIDLLPPAARSSFAMLNL